MKNIAARQQREALWTVPALRATAFCRGSCRVRQITPFGSWRAKGEATVRGREKRKRAAKPIFDVEQ
jgi:hypothetical protein